MNTTPIRLDPWVELIGILQRIFHDKSHIYLEIADRLLTFPRESAASKIILTSLSQRMIGRKIGILSTDLPDKPIIIRILSVHGRPTNETLFS